MEVIADGYAIRFRDEKEKKAWYRLNRMRCNKVMKIINKNFREAGVKGWK